LIERAAEPAAASGGEPLSLAVTEGISVSALLLMPEHARTLLVLAHGAGAGMRHPSMQTLATQLAARGIGTLRYQFPYMERGSRRPDPPALCHATVRAAVGEAANRAEHLCVIAGGRSFGGRMTSQAQAAAPLPGVAGLVFFAFPLHPAGRPSDERARHLFQTELPMLFLSGTRDALAEWPLMQALAKRLGPRATMQGLQEADHSFHVPARSGRGDGDVLTEALDALAGWIERLTPSPQPR
jgi:predicted alpha/beta-hydrolase family hydrolase